MSRPTDTERGARMACVVAMVKQRQPDLFPGALDAEFWYSVERAADEQLAECRAYREALRA